MNGMDLTAILLPTKEVPITGQIGKNKYGKIIIITEEFPVDKEKFILQYIYITNKKAKIPTKWYYDDFIKGIRNTSGAQYEFSQHIFPILFTNDPKLITSGVPTIPEKIFINILYGKDYPEDESPSINVTDEIEENFLEEFVKQYNNRNAKGVDIDETWNEVFRIVFNPDVSFGTKEAMVREKFNPPIKKGQTSRSNTGQKVVDVEKLLEMLDDIDSMVMQLEDVLHGNEGKQATSLRHGIIEIKNELRQSNAEKDSLDDMRKCFKAGLDTMISSRPWELNCEDYLQSLTKEQGGVEMWCDMEDWREGLSTIEIAERLFKEGKQSHEEIPNKIKLVNGQPVIHLK